MACLSGWVASVSLSYLRHLPSLIPSLPCFGYFRCPHLFGLFSLSSKHRQGLLAWAPVSQWIQAEEEPGVEAEAYCCSAWEAAAEGLQVLGQPGQRGRGLFRQSNKAKQGTSLRKNDRVSAESMGGKRAIRTQTMSSYFVLPPSAAFLLTRCPLCKADRSHVCSDPPSPHAGTAVSRLICLMWPAAAVTITDVHSRPLLMCSWAVCLCLQMQFFLACGQTHPCVGCVWRLMSGIVLRWSSTLSQRHSLLDKSRTHPLG